MQTWKWGHDPTTDARSLCGYVGLLNPGCVCYCNSVLQQLFMVPDFRLSVLQSHRNATGEGAAEDDNTVLLGRLQMVFGFLQNSRRKAHAPTEFLRAFKVEYRRWPCAVNARVHSLLHPHPRLCATCTVLPPPTPLPCATCTVFPSPPRDTPLQHVP